jgi:hypothetical protein
LEGTNDKEPTARDLVRGTDHKLTIGMIICAEKRERGVDDIHYYVIGTIKSIEETESKNGHKIVLERCTIRDCKFRTANGNEDSFTMVIGQNDRKNPWWWEIIKVRHLPKDEATGKSGRSE